MLSAITSHPTPSPSQLSSSLRSAAARSVGSMRSRGPWNVAQPGQGVVVRRPCNFEMRHGEPGSPAFRGEPSDGGRVMSLGVYLCGSEHVWRRGV